MEKLFRTAAIFSSFGEVHLQSLQINIIKMSVFTRRCRADFNNLVIVSKNEFASKSEKKYRMREEVNQIKVKLPDTQNVHTYCTPTHETPRGNEKFFKIIKCEKFSPKRSEKEENFLFPYSPLLFLKSDASFHHHHDIMPTAHI